MLIFYDVKPCYVDVCSLFVAEEETSVLGPWMSMAAWAESIPAQKNKFALLLGNETKGGEDNLKVEQNY